MGQLLGLLRIAFVIEHHRHRSGKVEACGSGRVPGGLTLAKLEFFVQDSHAESNDLAGQLHQFEAGVCVMCNLVE